MKDMLEIIMALGVVAFLLAVGMGIVGASFMFWINLLG